MIELLIAVVLAAAAVWFVLHPIFNPPLAGSELRDAANVEDEEDPDDDMSPRAVAFRALHEIEFDRETGKLSDADYAALHQKYTAEAVAVMRLEDREAGVERRERAAAPPPASRLPPPACPSHGPRPEPDAVFCSECGRRLGSKPGYCARCGAGLELEARYCNACGSRVAA